MFFYKIGYGTQDGCKYKEFYFSERLNKEELTKYIAKATENVLNKDFPIIGVKGPDFEGLYTEIMNELTELGFTPIQFTTKWTCQGDDPICIDREETELENKLLTELLPLELKREILKKARKRKK